MTFLPLPARVRTPWIVAGACALLISRFPAPVLAGDVPVPGTPGLSVGPAPSWVEPVEPPPAPSGGDPFGGRIAVLDELQIHGERKETYSRSIMEFANMSGLDGANEFEFEFDPSYQTLTLHRIGIHRDGRYLDRLEDADIQVIRPESDRRLRVYDGRLTVIVFVEDVRVGDRLEIAFTRRGRNPVMADHFVTDFPLQYPWSVDRLYVRVLHDTSREMHRQESGDVPRPEVRDADGTTEIRWDLRDRPGLEVEDLLPRGFNPYPFFHFSDFRGWEDVARWGHPLYQPAEITSAALRARIRQWREIPDPEDRAVAVLRFLQDEVAYLAFAMGEGSLRPSDPNVVFDRRFGDCKDKALLLCTTLGECGIDGRAALVSTASLGTIENLLPSPMVFDHVIVRIRIGSRDYWVDPTLSHQRGSLKTQSALPFRRALVLEPGALQLSTVPLRAKRARTEIRERFSVADYDSAVSLDVETVMTGARADDMRATLAASTGDLGRDYLNFYAATYPGVRSAAPLEFDDAPVENRITVRERYLIDGFWVPDETRSFLSFEVRAYGIAEFLLRPAHRFRTMPVGVPFPFNAKHTIEIALPEPFLLEPDPVRIEDDAFRYEFDESYHGNVVRCVFELTSLKDAVPPDRVAEYVARLDEMEDTLTYSLVRPAEGALAGGGLNWPLILLACGWSALLGGGSIVLLRRARRRWPPAMPVDADPKLSGIGGWLVLPAIGVGLQPLLLLAGFSQFGYVFSADQWAAVTSPGMPGYDESFAPLLVFELLGNLTLLVVSMALVPTFFRRRRVLPDLFAIFLFGRFVFMLTDTFLALPAADLELEQGAGKEAFRSFLQAAIWIPYFKISRRVRATFVW